jgi:hypothetical protein
LGGPEDVYVERCSISNAQDGIIIFTDNNPVSFIDCDVMACKDNCIFINGSSQVQISDCTMSGSEGCGAYILECGDVTIDACQLMNNGSNGAMILHSNATISNCTVSGNGIGSNSYGIQVIGAAYTYEIDNCMVSGNRSGIYFNITGGLLSNSKVWDNEESGIVCVGATATPEITYTKITGNEIGVWVVNDANPILGIKDEAGQNNSIYDQEPSGISGDVDYDPWLKKDPLEYLYPSSRETRILSLAQNYPNPLGATGSTNIRYSIPNDSEPVSLVVYDVNGRRIRVLVNDVQTAGEHFVKWDGRNEHGKRVAAGIYFYRLKVGGASLAKKMILLY